MANDDVKVLVLSDSIARYHIKGCFSLCIGEAAAGQGEGQET